MLAGVRGDGRQVLQATLEGPSGRAVRQAVRARLAHGGG